MDTASDHARPVDATVSGTVMETASAKVNLALHVTGRRPDGYHLLHSLVVFADVGDRLEFSLSDRDSIAVTGPYAGTLEASMQPGQDNLIAQARDALRNLAAQSGKIAPPVAIRLDKQLPVAAGIGGGSADAAATLRGLMRLWDFRPGSDAIEAVALSLGADVPMCLASTALIAGGIGEALSPLDDFPALDMVLVNPGAPVATPSVFRAFDGRFGSPLPDMKPGGEMISALATMRNDLEAPARSIEQSIGMALDGLESAGAALARMSGSGATCFGLFADAEAARAAADALRADHPNWYVRACRTGSSQSGAPS